MSTSRFIPNRRFQFGYTLSSRPAVATLKVIAQKVEATTLCGVDDAGLFRMQPQSGNRRPALHFCERRSGLGCAATENDEVSSPQESHPQALAEPYLNLSAHTAPAIEPRRTPICQCAHNFGSRLEIRATQCVALRKWPRSFLYFR